MKIVVVDDDHYIAELLSELLTRFGYECKTAANGREALDLLQEDSFSFVLTDMKMPVMDGMELLHEIKQRYPHIDVICMTGHGGTYTFTDVIKAGASDFILKPFAEDEVEAKINRVFSERQLRADMLSISEILM